MEPLIGTLYYLRVLYKNPLKGALKETLKGAPLKEPLKEPLKGALKGSAFWILPGVWATPKVYSKLKGSGLGFRSLLQGSWDLVSKLISRL